MQASHSKGRPPALPAPTAACRTEQACRAKANHCSAQPTFRRFGALPLLNRHFYSISKHWPISCGVYELAEPAKRITKKVSQLSAYSL